MGHIVFEIIEYPNYKGLWEKARVGVTGWWLWAG